MARALLVLVFVINLGAQVTPGSEPPTDPAAALAAWRDYDYPQAEKLYRSIVTGDPSSAEAQAGLIRSLLDEKRLPEARRAADAALKLLPDTAEVVAANGDLLYREGDLNAADAAYQKAIKIDAKLARGWFGIARIAFIDARSRTGTRALEQARELDPADPEIAQFWAAHLPRPERRKALEHLVDHAGHMDPDRLSALQSNLAWLIVLGNKNAWELTGKVDSAKLKLDHVIVRSGGFNSGFAKTPTHVSAVALQVQINGHKNVRLMIDTGASGIILTRAAAIKSSVKQIYETVSRGIGDEKDSSGFLGWANSLKIGPIEFQNVPVTALDGRFPPDCDGLIGINVFEHFLITLDIQHSELDLAALPAIPDSYKDSEGNFDRYVSAEMKDFRPVVHVGAHILIPTSVDDRPARMFLLDTGAFDSQIDTGYVDPSKLTELSDIPVRGLSGRVNDVVLTSNVQLRFGPFVQNNFHLLALSMEKFSEGDGLGIKGILGFPLLSQFRLKIDYRDGLVDFEYLGGKH